MAGEYGGAGGSRPRRVLVAESSPLRLGLLVGLGFAIVALAAVAAWQVRVVLAVLFAAAFMAVGLNRPVRWLMRHGMSRALAVTLLVLAAVLALCGGLALLIPAVITQATQFFAALPGMVDAIMASPAVGKLQAKSQISDSVDHVVSPQNIMAAVGGVLGGVVSVVGFLVLFGTTVVLSMFILAGFDQFRHGAYRLIPGTRRERVGGIVDQILAKVGAYLVGAVSIAAVAGVCASVFMFIAGIPYAVLLGLVVAVLDMIPQIGATLGACAVVAVALSESPGQAIAAIVFFVVYQQIENWIVYPRVMKHAVEISNLAAIVSVLLGGALFGVLGVLIAVPGYAAAQLVVREFVIPKLEAS